MVAYVVETKIGQEDVGNMVYSVIYQSGRGIF